MPEPLKVRNRARLREKEAERVAHELEAMLGVAPWAPGTHLDKGESQRGDVLVGNGRVLAFFLPPEHGSKVAPAVRLVLERKPSRSFVTVDMGAVKFVNNGADVMGPGIVEADPGLLEGSVCWIRDERNKRPLAIGQALVPGLQMPKQPGKKVRNLQRVGDELWNWEP